MLLSLVLLLAGAQHAYSQPKPLVWVLSTGGTIAGKGATSTTLSGYKSGAFRGVDLVNGVPEIR